MISLRARARELDTRIERLDAEIDRLVLETAHCEVWPEGIVRCHETLVESRDRAVEESRLIGSIERGAA